MQTTPKRIFRQLALVIRWITPLLITSTIFAQSGGRGTLSDAVPNMVRSDGAGPYLDNVDCVSVAIAGSGFWQLRTVQNSGVCNGEPSYWTPGAADYHRWLTLDFGTGTPPGDLDGNGIAAAVEFAPARFVFNDAFARKAASTPVHIYILRVLANGATTQDTAWEIEYRSSAHITLNPDGSRTLWLVAGAATADVYAVTSLPHGKTQSNYMGTYDLPFSVVAK